MNRWHQILLLTPFIFLTYQHTAHATCMIDCSGEPVLPDCSSPPIGFDPCNGDPNCVTSPFAIDWLYPTDEKLHVKATCTQTCSAPGGQGGPNISTLEPEASYLSLNTGNSDPSFEKLTTMCGDMWVFRYSDYVAAGGPYNIQISMEMNTNVAKVTFVDDLFPVTDGGAAEEENTDAGDAIEDSVDSGLPVEVLDSGEAIEVVTDSGNGIIETDAGTNNVPDIDAGTLDEDLMIDAGAINTTPSDAGTTQTSDAGTTQTSDAGTADSEITCADNPCEPGQICRDNPEGYECRIKIDGVIEPGQIGHGCGCQQTSSSKNTAFTFSLLFLWALGRRSLKKRNRHN